MEVALDVKTKHFESWENSQFCIVDLLRWWKWVSGEAHVHGKTFTTVQEHLVYLCPQVKVIKGILKGGILAKCSCLK